METKILVNNKNMKQTAHSVNSSKNLLLVSNNRENNTEASNDTYSNLTSPEEKINQRSFDDIQNNSFSYNNLANNSISYNNNIIYNTTSNLLINNSFTNNNNNNNSNNCVLMSNSSNINNSFSLNNNSTRNLLGNNSLNMNTSMNQLHPTSVNLNTSFNNSYKNNNAQIYQNTSSNILKPIATATPQPNVNNSMNNSINNSINNSNNNSFNNSFNMNTSSHNIKILNTINSMDIPVTSSIMTKTMNKGTSSPPVPPLAIGKDDSDFEEEKEKQIVVIVDPSTYNLPVNEVPIPVTTDPAVVPNSVEDWIKYHASIDPDRKFLPPDEPPSKIPVLESTVPLDEVITPQRSVSCRIRLLQQQRRKKAQELAEQEKLLQQNNSKSLNNAMNNDAIVYSSPSIKVPAAVRSTKKIKTDPTNVRNGTTSRYSNQKPTPRFQLCTYNKCEWIATNKCEKCSNLCCLDHSHRFYFFFPSLFTPKYYCPDCMNSVSRFWRYAYLVAGTIFAAILIVGIIYNYKGKGMGNIVFPLFSIIMVSLILSSYSLSYLSNQYTEKTKENEKLLLD